MSGLVNGMEFLLLREGRFYHPDRKQHINDIDHPDLGHISVSAIVLNRDLPGWLKAPRNTSRVFHAVNGQVQFKQNRGYLSQRCKFPGLKDRIVLVVDASDLSEAAHNDVWKGDRENIRATRSGQLYIDEVTKLIVNSDYLKELQRRIAQEETENLIQEGQITLFQELVNTDPSIAQLLPGGALVKLRGDIGRGDNDEDDEWKGKYSPTFIELIGRSVKQSGAEIAVDGRRMIAFKTDVENGYLTRPDNRGRVFVTGGVGDKFPYTRTIHNGRFTMTFQSLPERVSVGDEFAFSVGLLDDAMPEPVTEKLRLRVVASRPTPPRPPPPPPPPPPPGGRDLPPSKWLTKDGRPVVDEETKTDIWPDGFTDQDGGKVEDLGEDRKVYFINYDNAHFRHCLDQERNEGDRKVITEQYRIGMLVLMMGLEDAYSRMEQTTTKADLEEYIDEIRRLSAQGASTVVMSIARTLHTIINPASVAGPDDD